MKSISFRIILLAFCLLIVTFCHSKKEGSVEGSVVPPAAGVHVTASQSGKTVLTVDANEQDGKYAIPLAPGTYDISVTAPSSPFPMNFTGVSVSAGKTATLPPVEIAQRSGAASISGTVSPNPAGTIVTLLAEGKERAKVAAATDGKYEFTELPEGNYTVSASSPGYADDQAEVRIAGEHSSAQNLKLLYVTPIDGIDWTKGVIRAKGRGRYPANIMNRTAMYELAKRAALSDAERNLLRIVEQIKVDPNHELKSSMPGDTFTTTVRGFLKGFKIVDEHEIEGGVEVELELPLNGSGGLTRFLPD